MKRSRRVEISFEVDRPIVPAGNHEDWCETCQTHARMLTVDEAALLLEIKSRAVFHLVEEGTVHSSETSQGLLRICLNSLVWISTQTQIEVVRKEA